MKNSNLSRAKSCVINIPSKTAFKSSSSIARIRIEKEEGRARRPSIEMTRIVDSILDKPENQCCADCTTKCPTWAIVNHGGFVCFDCAGIHRSLGVHVSFVMSCKLDTSWTSVQLDLLNAVGNVRLNDKMEYHVPSGIYKPNPESTREIRVKYITAKYSEKKFQNRNSRPRLNPVVDPCSLPRIKASGRQGMVEYKGIVNIELIEGCDFNYKKITEMCSPYVVVRIGGQAVASKKLKHTLNPKWNQMLLLPWDGNDALMVEIVDAKTIGKDKVFGTATIQAEVLTALNETQAIDVWQPMVHPKHSRNFWVPSSASVQKSTVKLKKRLSAVTLPRRSPNWSAVVKQPAKVVKNMFRRSSTTNVEVETQDTKNSIMTISASLHFRLTFKSLAH